jgi:uncharacterized membrane protein YeaQ/YmgE (transglycosylase-associated protein family)
MDVLDVLFMDMLLWVVLGLGGGWVGSTLMLAVGDRRAAGTVAGMVGALLGGTAMGLIGPAGRADHVTSAAAALAGALGLTFVVCLVTFGRQSGGRPLASANARAPRAPLDPGLNMLTYEAARDALVQQLRSDAAAHEAERYDEVGRRFDAVERELPRGSSPELTKLHVALTFWDGWIEARNLGWPSGGNIPKAEWPLRARGIAADLAGDRDITDERVRTRFDTSGRQSLSGRVQTLAARLRAPR